jgi:glyoxylase I family protein
MIKGIWHVNINVTNFDRSLAFYQMLGFKVVHNLGEGSDPGLAAGLKVLKGVSRAALLALSDDPRATRVDLIEWKDPKTEGQPYPHLYHVGMARLALFTVNLDEEYQRLNGQGVKFLSEPQFIQIGSRRYGKTKFVCFTDPDGTILELIEPGRSVKA